MTRSLRRFASFTLPLFVLLGVAACGDDGDTSASGGAGGENNANGDRDGDTISDGDEGTDDPDGEGLSSLSVVGALRLDFNANDRQPVVPVLVQTWLGKLGEYIGRRQGLARLVRT